MSHSFLTVAVPLDPAHVQTVETILTDMGNPASRPVRDRLRGKGIHFMSMTIVPGGMDHGPFWVIESSADSPGPGAPDALKTIVNALQDHVLSIWEAAGLGSVSQGESTLTKIEAELRKYSYTVGQSLFSIPGLCFGGTPGMSLERIRQEYELGRHVRGLLESGQFRGTPLQILQQVRTAVQKNPELEPLLQQHSSPLLAPTTGSTILARILNGVVRFTWPYLLCVLLAAFLVGAAAWSQIGLLWGLIAFVFVLSIGFVGLVGIAGYVYSTLRKLEESDVPDNSVPDPVRLSASIRNENKTEQNHLYGISVLKAGIVRNLVLRIVFWVIVQAAASSRPGFLGELGTIHFARWFLLPKTDKLLFYSNYGGSWESYLEDFITKAHGGLTGVWSNTVGFPKTKNVFQDGATDGDRFKRWARSHQYPTLFWYSAYPHLTTARIRLNTAIRQGLSSAATEDEAAQWISCMGSRPRSGAILEKRDVQAILFGGLKPLNHARCLMLKLPNDVVQSRKWLADVQSLISYGDTLPQHVARLIALTASGLRKLGCDEQVLAGFPIAFQEGMAKRGPTLLSDTGDDKPEYWSWGAGDNTPDATLLLYADAAEGLEEEVVQRIRQLTGLGGSEIYQIPLEAYDPKEPIREPFGFVDGISQPIIKGTRRWIAESDANHVVEPGEFLLGYRDNRGFFPLSPTVRATADPHNILPSHREAELGELPEFTRLAANGPRDLGKNGSFLVIRQLEQNVDLFKKFLSTAATELSGRQGVPEGLSHDHLQEWLAAKIVGRWRDGTSLVRYPHAPGSGWLSQKQVKPDNTFLLGAEDPLGEGCPFGAHIRRTNPRDSLVPGSKTQIEITNRHRILRMGRVYSPMQHHGQPAQPGLLFMCLNTDIERQFEFVQQTWASARLFHGLDGEVDPLLGRGGKGGRLTIPTEEGPILVRGIQDFVTVRGGSYFFLPGRRALRYLAGESTIAEDAWSYKRIETLDDPIGFESTSSEQRNFPDANPSWDEIH